jgi:small GTP-binding protein
MSNNNRQNKIPLNIRSLSHKVVIIGDANVGKTCLINRFYNDTFKSSMPTIGATHFSKNIENIKLDIWDTAGQERFKSMVPMYYKGAKAIIICFDTTNLESFKNSKKWLKDVSNDIKNAIFVLCGTKKDLINNREIAYEDAMNYCYQKNLTYFETSAKDDINIKEIFDYIASGILIEEKNIDEEEKNLNKNIKNKCNDNNIKLTLKKNKDLSLNRKCC